MTVTATISTKGRYDTTLPLTIAGILAQTVAPNQFVLFDDNDAPKDLRSLSPYPHLFSLLDVKGIRWFVIYGQKKGQLLNHQTALDRADTDLLWRLDDDEIPEPTCLENLLGVMKDPAVGAVGGLVLPTNAVSARPKFFTGKIEDIHNPNVQWYRWETGEPEEVDHLYSTFLYRVEAGRKAGGYCRDLSPVAHREETIFSHEIKRAGYKLFVTPKAVTWHLREGTGGIRSYKDPGLWDHDEEVFSKKMKEWGVVPRQCVFVVLDNGIGDHVVFRSILPEIMGKHRGCRLVLFVCYPELFEGIDGITLASIADAKAAFGGLDRWNVYKWCEEHNWKGPLANAFRGIYL
jgi:hypothetical protein